MACGLTWAQLPPIPLPSGEGKHTEMKHSIQYNFRSLQCAKIASGMHQNTPFSTQKSKYSLGRRQRGTPLPRSIHQWGWENPTLHTPRRLNRSILVPSALDRHLPPSARHLRYATGGMHSVSRGGGLTPLIRTKDRILYLMRSFILSQ